ncbi:nicotinate (nicotinamide) nucleotide adenylyltransferase [Hydrogenimonas thermophila]|uniref:nicotinate (nicotinamide) nucleotide adenylyltransferase n=1 Tax=Hydrogenimonas thermophila TaxID=223786 RepID=UPI002936FF69|nr:nicotinate (nicotinamide) nucleotide adenylyltransferase [Hydrogenimonas thermophila]WOE69659.1 nicotinate (nicotinamide) nucleotide adenylyltransferase [Hydrogenimonas thermophila]WOE72173.1 nicotinate (nicotinamide) nucleotide adenylyltransferase [Hydrogenimonas thermophila]
MEAGIYTMEDKNRSVAIYGGSFDPPHIGHLEIIKKALYTLPIEKLIVIPAFISPFKKGHFAPPELRLKWLENITYFDNRIEISDFELKKSKKSYTIDTVNHFSSVYDTIFFIIGADNLKSLHKWHKFDELDKKVKWVVVTRDDVKIPDKFIKLDIDIPISSSILREEIDPNKIPEEIRDEVVKFYKN